MTKLNVLNDPSDQTTLEETSIIPNEVAIKKALADPKFLSQIQQSFEMLREMRPDDDVTAWPVYQILQSVKVRQMH